MLIPPASHYRIKIAKADSASAVAVATAELVEQTSGNPVTRRTEAAAMVKAKAMDGSISPAVSRTGLKSGKDPVELRLWRRQMGKVGFHE